VLSSRRWRGEGNAMSATEIKSEQDTKANIDKDFAFVEYKESCSAYFKGVDLGLAYIRYFFLMNAALVYVLALDEKALGKLGILQIIPYVVPVIGVFFSLMLSMILPYYRRSLELCEQRCIQIEEFLHGKMTTDSLFMRIQRNNNTGNRPVTADLYLKLIAIIVGALWFLSFPGLIPNILSFLK
jgi:hypothetical protein